MSVPRPQPFAIRLLAGALVLGLCSAAPEAARAAGSSRIADGLHISTGAVIAPDGSTWVADHNAGFCRVTAPTDTAVGHVDHPQNPGDPGPRTCLGGLLPDAGRGPDAAGQPAFFDPSPEFPGSGDELALIPDGATSSSEIVRARWNRDARRFEYQDTITTVGARTRPTAVSIGPDGNAYVSFQREDDVQEITDVDGPSPTARIVATTTDGRNASTVAAGRDSEGHLALYLAEHTGIISVVRPGAGTQVARPLGVTVPGTTVSALVYDLRHDRLYAGTADGVTQADAGIDVVHRIDVTQPAPVVEAGHATGFSMVGGFGMGPAGELLVVDDPALLDPAEPLGTGRMFRVGLPAGHVTGASGGRGATPVRFTSDTTPTFGIVGDGTLQCLLRGPGQTGAWTACPPDGEFTPAVALADGDYVLSVRAVADGVTGIPEAHHFTVDTVAPAVPVIVHPARGAAAPLHPWFEFAAEDHASFACRFDDEADLAPCTAGRTRTFTESGAHTLTIQAIDRAGNASADSATRSFTVDSSLATEMPLPWGPGPVTHRGSTRYADGLHVPAGAIVDPAGRIWVADHNAGFCRVTALTDDGPGHVEHPLTPGAGGPHTCLGGLLPEAGVGPEAAGQPSFVDPTPARNGNGDEVVLIPDGASASSEIVRAAWNPDSRLFEYRDTISTVGARTRPVATSLGPDGSVYVVFQRSGTVQRIVRPAGADPAAEVVGTTADGRRASAVAAGRDELGRTTVYLGEDAGIGRLRPSAVAPPLSQPSGLALPAGAAISALLSDLATDHLWVGTADGVTVADAGIDRLHRFTTSVAGGAPQLGYATGYSMIGGLGLRPDGVVYVLDDPALLDPAEPLGTGRLFHVGLPAAHVTRGPLDDADVQALDGVSTTDPTPTFVVAGEGVVECSLRGPGIVPAWAACPAGGRFTPATALADGAYRLVVRSRDGDELGLPESRAFTVDTVAPARPVITSPEPAPLVGAAPWFAFAAEDGATFRCRFDAELVFTACLPGRTRAFTGVGGHTLSIQAVDRAGNVSDASAPVAFRTAGHLEEVRIDEARTGRSTSRSARFAFSGPGAEGTEFSCRLDGQPFAVCTSPVTYTGLADGTHAFDVRARDFGGDVTPVARRTFTVDTTGPVMTVAEPAEGGVVRSTAVVRLAASEAATWTCRIDDEPFAPCADILTVVGLTDGAHRFQVVGIDDLGNVGAVLTRTFTVATPAGAAPVAPGTRARIVGGPATLIGALRVAGIDTQIQVADVQAAGVQLTVVAPAGATTIRLRIFRVGGRRGRAAADGALATEFRVVRHSGRAMNVSLRSREVRRLRPGHYVLEVTARARGAYGAPVRRTFVVRG